MQRSTKIIEKLFVSLINVLITGAMVIPFAIVFGLGITLWLIWATLFFLLNLVFEFRFDRCPGMLVLRIHYNHRRNIAQKLLYCVFYTISFSTIFVWAWFPFDIFLANMILLQLPMVLKTGTTLHGFLAGKLVTMKDGLTATE